MLQRSNRRVSILTSLVSNTCPEYHGLCARGGLGKRQTPFGIQITGPGSINKDQFEFLQHKVFGNGGASKELDEHLANIIEDSDSK
eukprot:1478527-Alexandrium_andersonii.AAC.1